MARNLDLLEFALVRLRVAFETGDTEQTRCRELRIIDHLREESRVLREQLGARRVRLNDDQRRRLAVKAKDLADAMRIRTAKLPQD
jgi:hypothetical protein